MHVLTIVCYRFYYNFYLSCLSDEDHVNALDAVTGDEMYSHDENIQGEGNKYL